MPEMADPVRIIAALKTPQRILRKYCLVCFLMVFLPFFTLLPAYTFIKSTAQRCANGCANTYPYYIKGMSFSQATLSRSIYQSCRLFFMKKEQTKRPAPKSQPFPP